MRGVPAWHQQRSVQHPSTVLALRANPPSPTRGEGRRGALPPTIRRVISGDPVCPGDLVCLGRPACLTRPSAGASLCPKSSPPPCSSSATRFCPAAPRTRISATSPIS
ncbi:MAG: hypothetical protein EOR03_30045 [Mesorhizobium sp.]|nr:MAG: hypothetical protein EOR03_30045 [Mesorhizobium sp.]TIL65154.1 MAG: hypothetical protein E5Y77_22780 [Mesorhizobium sp.]